MQQEKHLTAVFEDSITSVEPLVKVVRAADEGLGNFLLINKACGPGFSITAFRPEHFQVNRWAAIRSQKRHKELVDTVGVSKGKLEVADTAYEHSWGGPSYICGLLRRRFAGFISTLFLVFRAP